MKRWTILSVAAGLCAVTTLAFAQLPEQAPEATEPPAAAKFELIQNSRAMSETYLLDRYFGRSWQLVKYAKRYDRQNIPKESHDKDIVPKDWEGPAYQISVSGLAAKGTYMINVITGATWILFEDPEEGIFWGAIPEPK